MYVDNKTPFEFMALPAYDKEGHEIFTNIIKGTFHIVKPGSLDISEKQVPITLADEYWGEPGSSPLKYESDLALFKPATDLILLGFAWHYGGKKVRSIDIQFRGGSRRKKATVECSVASEKLPLTLLEEKDWLGSRRPGDGFGFFPKNKPPRSGYSGTYDERWRKERAPFLPADFDYRFFQSAYPELITDGYLKGNEKVFAENVSPDGPISFNIPSIQIEVKTIFEHKTIKSGTVLDTVVVEPEDQRVSMVWRQMIPCQNMIQDVQGFEINNITVS